MGNHVGAFPIAGQPQFAGWFIMENPIEVDLGASLLLEVKDVVKPASKNQRWDFGPNQWGNPCSISTVYFRSIRWVFHVLEQFL